MAQIEIDLSPGRTTERFVPRWRWKRRARQLDVRVRGAGGLEVPMDLWAGHVSDGGFRATPVQFR